MAWTKAKTAIVTGAALILAATITTPIVVHVVHQHEEPFFTSKTALADSDNAAYQSLSGTTPAEVVKTFFDACSREDWNAISKLLGGAPDDKFKKYYGGLEVISLGQPFRGQWSNQDFQGPQVYVPYEIRLKDGTVHKWQLAICCDGQHHWYFDGGF
jgi:hypothetical protein